MEEIKIATCNNGHIPNYNLARTLMRSQKIRKDLRKCTFNLCASMSIPFIRSNCTDGMEIELIHLLQEKMNFQVLVSKNKML